ncbi:hypothetical protein MNBD_ALPHA06-2052 [hydrothermal vent metagenome]|uniref:Tetratricopeptide repeat-like domain-containing protein n=1 Tax=hydrothermal vent metagenome TaxID=652676 RepID=A0A3B0RKI5_9ZZZZ
MSKPKPKRRLGWREYLLVLILIVAGGLLLFAKAGREAPIRFSAQELPVGAQKTLLQASDALANATPQDLQRAKIYLTALTNEYPDYPPSQAQLALVLAVSSQIGQKNNWQLAERGAEQVLQEYPFQTDALLALAWVKFYRDGGADKAEKLVNKAMKQDRYNVYGLALLADIAASRDKFKLAARFSQTLSLQNPQALWLRLPECRYQSRAQQWKLAIRACERVLQIAPTDVEATALLNAAKNN